MGVQLSESGPYTVLVRPFAGTEEGAAFLVSLAEGAVYLSPTGEPAQTLTLGEAQAVELDAQTSALFLVNLASDEPVTVSVEAAEQPVVHVYSAEGFDLGVLGDDLFTPEGLGDYLLVLVSEAPVSGSLLVTQGEVVVQEPTTTVQGAILSDGPTLGSVAPNETQVFTFTPLQSGDYSFALNARTPESPLRPLPARAGSRWERAGRR
ncbi:MAG: hypothetical protein HC915_13680 [Anaerolineae bacterium]|nr:hypothetical protein [Anaerolineae bacterium]